MKKLIITEFKEEAQYFVEHKPELLNDAEILSFLPESHLVWSKNNKHFHNTLSYFSKESHESCLLIIEDMFNKTMREIHMEDNNGITKTYDNSIAAVIRNYLTYIVYHIEVIDTFLNKNDVNHIYAGRYTNNDYQELNLDAKERILGDIIKLFGTQYNVHLNDLEVPKELLPNRAKSLSKTFLSAVLNRVQRLLYSSNKQPSILFYSLKFNFDKIARQLKNYRLYDIAPVKNKFLKFKYSNSLYEAFNVHLSRGGYFTDQKLQTSIDESLRNIKALHHNERVFSYKGYDFSKIFFRKFEEGYYHDYKLLNREITCLKKTLNSIKPSLIVAPMSRELSFAIAEFAKKMNVPSLLISHGSHVPPKNQYDTVEWNAHSEGMINTEYKYHLLQSPWAEKFVHTLAHNNDYVRIKPIIFSTVERKDKEAKQLSMYPESRGKKIIVHASTPKPRLQRFYIYETLDEYVQNMKDLIQVTEQMDDVFLIIRFRPYPYLTMEMLEALLPKSEHYVIATEGSFADYIQIADLMVSFSSTTIEEALTNNVPVLQYDRTGRYVHIPGAEWNGEGFNVVDSVYSIGRQKHLAEGIEWIVNHHLKQDIHDDVFKRHKFDEQNAVDAGTFIQDLMNGRSFERFAVAPKKSEYRKTKVETAV